MNGTNISQAERLAQHSTVAFDENGNVFCPMCEIWHENNTWCQANFSDMAMEG